MKKDKETGGLTGAKILVVEDERDLAGMIAFALRRRGHEVAEAYDGVNAWQKIRAGNPDLVVLDLMLPEVDGWEVCRMIRRDENKEIRETGVLMLSARAEAEDRVRGLELGADDYLTKPFSLDELRLREEKILTKRQAVRGLYEEVSQLHGKMQEQEAGLRRVVHDLKTPLIAMGASAKLLMRRDPHEENLDFLKNIYENSLRLTHWLEEILLFSDSPFKGMASDMEEAAIPALVKRTIDLLRATGGEKNIEVSFESQPCLPTVLCNVKWMQRALENLIANAVKYTPEGGRVEIGVFSHEEGETVEIVIRDNGIGILPDDLPKIFEPFQRGRNALGEKGIGLGLSLVKEVVDLHGGRMEVQSEPGRGSVFAIVLPVHRGVKQKGGEVDFTII